MLKREIKRIQLTIERFLEPVGILALLLLFTVPTLTLLNLDTKVKDFNVLGVSSQDSIGVVLVGGVHEAITLEKLNGYENSYYYSASLKNRDEGVYSKPIVQIQNKTGEKQVVTFKGSTEISTATVISLILNGEEKVLQRSDGGVYNVSFKVDSGEVVDLYMKLENTDTINFDEDFGLSIGIQ